MKLIKLHCVIALLFLAACDGQMDDQTKATAVQLAAVNPEPLPRMQNHKIIVAVLDSGVDYNHPALLKNVLPTGWDFPGNDQWAHPLIARTEEKPEITSGLEELYKEFPEMKVLFAPGRSVEEESEESYDHGTHVAGIIAKGGDEIGIRAYRILPLNRFTDLLDEVELARKFADVLVLGMEKAIADGASIINMSLGITIDLTSGRQSVFATDFEKRLAQVIDANPEVLFVVAAGNEGQHIDRTKIQVLPCGLKRKNVICVGNLRGDGKISAESNYLEDALYVRGTDIESTVPLQGCSNSELSFENLHKGPAVRALFAEEARRLCLPNNGFRTYSGTSMAAPAITREAALLKIRTPGITLQELRRQLTLVPGVRTFVDIF